MMTFGAWSQIAYERRWLSVSAGRWSSSSSSLPPSPQPSPCYAMLCYDVLCCAVLCCAVAHYAMTCYVVVCYCYIIEAGEEEAIHLGRWPRQRQGYTDGWSMDPIRKARVDDPAKGRATPHGWSMDPIKPSCHSLPLLQDVTILHVVCYALPCYIKKSYTALR